MRPRLCALPKVSLIGVADVGISLVALSLSCGRKGWGVMHDEPVLMHSFHCPANCKANNNFELYATGGGPGSGQGSAPDYPQCAPFTTR